MPPDAANRMCAQSRVATAGRDGTTRVTDMYAEAPLLLKITRAKEPEPELAAGAARVSLTSGAAGPIGGDDYRLDVDVGAGSTLVLTEVSPSLLLPGPDGATSTYTVTVTVGEAATLAWLAEPLITAHGCSHVHDIWVELHPSARLIMREELLLGRYGETSGTARQRISVRRGGAVLHRQELSVGPGAVGHDGAAVLGTARAVGSVLAVDPVWAAEPVREHLISPNAAVLPLAGPAVLVTAVAQDSLALRRDLHAGLAALGPPWQLR